MPKRNQRGKFKKRKNRDIELKTVNQEYGVIQQALGDCRFLVLLEDKREVLGILKGSFRNRVRIFAQDTVLVSLRNEFDRFKIAIGDTKTKEKVDIIYKYFPTEVNFLINNGHIKYLSDSANKEDLEDEDREFDDIINQINNSENKNDNDIDIDVNEIDI